MILAFLLEVTTFQPGDSVLVIKGKFVDLSVTFVACHQSCVSVRCGFACKRLGAESGFAVLENVCGKHVRGSARHMACGVHRLNKGCREIAIEKAKTLLSFGDCRVSVFCFVDCLERKRDGCRAFWGGGRLHVRARAPALLRSCPHRGAWNRVVLERRTLRVLVQYMGVYNLSPIQ